MILIEGVGALFGYEFNNINDKTNNLVVENENWELIQIGLLLLNYIQAMCLHLLSGSLVTLATEDGRLK